MNEMNVNEEAINRLPQADSNPALGNPPTLPETEKSISQLSRGKAPGADAVPAEAYKHGGPRYTTFVDLTKAFDTVSSE